MNWDIQKKSTRTTQPEFLTWILNELIHKSEAGHIACLLPFLAR